MGRSIIAVLLGQFSRFLTHVSINSAPECLLVTVYHLCCTLSLLPSHRRKGEGADGHWVDKGRAKPLRLLQLDRHWGEVLTESRPRLRGTAVSVGITHWMRCSIAYEIGLADDSSEIGQSIGAIVGMTAEF